VAKTICVDFDGVLHAHMSPFTTPDVIADGPVDGAMEWLDAMIEEGFEIAVFSTRSGAPGGIDAMANWIDEHGGNSLVISFPTEKPIAFLSIDDRGWTFQGTFPTVAEIEAFRPWNMRPFGMKPEAAAEPEPEKRKATLSSNE